MSQTKTRALILILILRFPRLPILSVVNSCLPVKIVSLSSGFFLPFSLSSLFLRPRLYSSRIIIWPAATPCWHTRAPVWVSLRPLTFRFSCFLLFLSGIIVSRHPVGAFHIVSNYSYSRSLLSLFLLFFMTFVIADSWRCLIIVCGLMDRYFTSSGSSQTLGFGCGSVR